VFEKVNGWLRQHWWGLFIAYFLLLVMFYCAIWTVMEPMNVPDILELPTFMRSRLFYHLAATALLASHFALILEAYHRRNWFSQGKNLVEGGTSEVHYGDTIKLIHFATGYTLHSHTNCNSHPKSSGQQQVTGFSGRDSNDDWIIKPQHGIKLPTKVGQVVRHKDTIRLEHVNTGRNLHSHQGVPSAITSQQEITAFGFEGEGDPNDNWQMICLKGNSWLENERVRLIHVNSKVALHSHNGRCDPIFTAGQQEVTGYGARDENDFWFAERIEAT
jgi:dolichyl-phosphate-mannose--protein O-mannosyl transferase